MFSPTVSRIVRTGPASLPVSSAIPPRASSALIAAAARHFPKPTHQRRHSSSKPSSPSDGSRGFDPQQQNPANPSSRSAARLKRKAKEASVDGSTKSRDDAYSHLPSVPSTHHLHPADVAVSAFFSLHRPISVTASVPNASSETAFNTIFDSRLKNNSRTTEVISTLSSAVDSLEAASGQGAQMSEEESDLRAAVMQASVSNAESVHHLDGQPDASPLQFPSHLLNGKYKPFSPPPPPTPVASAKDVQAVEEAPTKALTKPSDILRRSYSTILTIVESSHPNGLKTYNVRTSPIVESKDSAAVRSSFLGRMLARQERWEEFKEQILIERGITKRIVEGQSEGMLAISVKRQRKLKMKKHKYKKLMRRTRNLRRRLDRN